MEESNVRVQDDLYSYINKKWLDEAVIPSDKPCVGGFINLDTNVEKQLIEDFTKISNKELDCPNKVLDNAILLFDMIKNTSKRKKDGVKPLLKDLKALSKINTIQSFNKKLADLLLLGFPLPFKIDVDTDMKNTNNHCVMITGPSVILPDSSYYKDEMKEQKEGLLALWKSMAFKLLEKCKLIDSEIEEYIAGAIEFDSLVAKYVKSNEEWSEYTKMYNPFKASKVYSLLKPIKLKGLLASLFTKEPVEIIVTEPRYFKAFKEVLNEDTFSLYKKWAFVMMVLDKASYLTEEMRIDSGIYRRGLSGIKDAPAVEKYAYRTVSSIFSEPIGLYYGEKYFGEEAKKDIISIVNEIIKTYKERIQNNTFLQDCTKAKAIVKLDNMKIKMGYPDKYDSLYDLFIIDNEKSLYENISMINSIRLKDSFSKLYEIVNRGKWPMPGHMVNACYNPFSNDITFPAAILQPPFYSIKQSKSQNLGGIGAVIGHEISHAFDNNGSLCDEFGNLNNWWTNEDFKQFKNKTKAMINEFDGIDLGYGIVNGSFVVSENIADNGGMAVTLEIMKSLADADYKEYFMNWARIWCMKAKEEYLKLLLAIDVHSPVVLRANMQPRNFEEWYEVFDVKKTDKMYIPKAKRVVIW